MRMIKEKRRNQLIFQVDMLQYLSEFHRADCTENRGVLVLKKSGGV
jgi:hypothetical protein